MAAYRGILEDVGPRRDYARRTLRVLALFAGVALIVGVAVFILDPLLPRHQQAAGVPTPSAVSTTSPSPTASLTLGALDTKLKARVLFGQEAVGASITSGVSKAYQAAGVPPPKVAAWSGVMNGKGPVFAYARVGKDGDPTSRLKGFAALVNDARGGSIDVALVELSYADITADSDVGAVFSEYTATMKSLEQAHPDVVFIYTTVPVTTENSWKSVDAARVTGLADATQPIWQHNIARERYNALVREAYGSTGRLFDVAAIEARIGKGKVAAKEHEGQWFYVLNPALSNDGRRPNPTGSKLLATELLRLIDAVSTP